MPENEFQDLTSLMKVRFGVTRSSPLRLTEKDTLFTAFRKLADNIYKNGEWTVEDEMQAVDTMMRNRNGVAVGTDQMSYYAGRDNGYLPMTIDVAPITDIERSRLGSRADNFSGYAATVTKQLPDGSSDEKKTFVLLDPENKKGTVHNQHYYFGGLGYYKDGTDLTDTVFYAEGNKNRAIGYDRLQKDILKEFDRQAVDSEVDGISRGNMEYYLQRLVNPKNSGKKNEKIFKKKSHGELTDEFLATLPRDESTHFWSVPPTEKEIEDGREPFNYRDLTDYPDDPNKLNLDKAPYVLSNSKNSKTFISPKAIPAARRHNKMVDFVQKYIESTYDIILQREYEKDIEKQTRASAWQTKKNINKETQELMEKTSLKDHFGFVELDNDVELDLFGQFEVEMKKIHELLPKTEVKADLRLRKLGNYRALGLYNSLTQTIAIDFRDYSDDINGIGIRSFIHEYGHFLDYSVGKGLLSMQENFQPFVARYRKKIETLPEKSYVRLKSHYYGTPTEVFARSFEMYAAECGLKSNLLQSKEAYRVLEEYSVMDDSMRKEIFEYFDQTFPEFKSKIHEFNGLPVLEEPLVDVAEETAPTIQANAIQEKNSLKQLENFSGNELDYLEKTIAVYRYDLMVADSQYESDIDFSVYEEKDHSWLQLTEAEQQQVESWISTELSPDDELQLLRVRDEIRSISKYKEKELSNTRGSNMPEERLIQAVESAAAEHDFKEEEAVMLQEADQKITALKNLQLSLDGELIPLEKALDHCDLSLLTKPAAIEHQKSEIEKYEAYLPRTESLDRITRMYKEQLSEFEMLAPDTIFLFDGSDNANYSINPGNIVSDIVELSAFQEAYGEAIYDFSDVTRDFGLYVDQTELANQTNQEYIQDGGEYIPIQTTEQMNKLLENENAVALPEIDRPFIEEYAEHVQITHDWTFDEIGHEYAEYKANGKAFHVERAEMDTTYDEIRSELVDRLMRGDIDLSAVYQESVLLQLSPEAQHYWKSTLNLDGKIEATTEKASEKQETLLDDLITTYPNEIVQGMKEKSTNDSNESQIQEKETSEAVVQPNDLDMSRLGQARRKLERLETELAGKFDQMYEHQRLTNGQPMNDKRNGRSWFNKQEKIDDSIRNLMQQIEEQKDRVEKYERHAEYKEMGMNKQGGLIMSVENIPRIKEEIEKSKAGESLFSRDTIRKYEKQLEVLEAAKDQVEAAENNLSGHAKALIESGNLTQWKKNPMIYFVKGLKKVAFELTPEGKFQLAAKYQPVTADEKARVEELLSGQEEVKEEDNMAFKGNDNLLKNYYEEAAKKLDEGFDHFMTDTEDQNYRNEMWSSLKANFTSYENEMVERGLLNPENVAAIVGGRNQKEGNHLAENKLSAGNDNDKEMNQKLRVVSNSFNLEDGVRNYQEELVSPELLDELKALDNDCEAKGKTYEFLFGKEVDGREEFIQLFVGDGLEGNASLYSQLEEMLSMDKQAGSYTEKSMVKENDYVVTNMIGKYEGQQSVLKVDSIPYEQVADCTGYHEELGFFQATLDPKEPQVLATDDQIKEFESEYQLMTNKIEENEESARRDAADQQPDSSKEPGHSLKGQNSHWDKVINSIEREVRAEKAEQQRDNHSMYGENHHWDAVIESLALSDNEVTKFPANALPNQEPNNKQELATLQNLLGDAVRRAEIILGGKYEEVSKALEELTIKELERYKESDLTAAQLLTITNEFQNKITAAISTYASDKANRIPWTERVNTFKDKVTGAVKNLKESVLNRLAASKNIPENSKNFAKSQLLRVVVNLNQTLQTELDKVEERLQTQATEKDMPVKPAAEGKKENPAVTSQVDSGIEKEPLVTDRSQVMQLIDQYKEEYGKHLLKNFNKSELTPNYDLMRKFDESLKMKPDLIAQLRLEATSSLRETELTSGKQTSPDKVNLDSYLTDKADGIAHSLKFMESTQQRAFLFKDLENTPYITKSSKEIREELMQQLQKEQASEKELENLASGAGKTSDAKDLFKESNENKLKLIERIEEINGGEKILSDREQKYSLYAAYHNLVQENPQITPEERKTAITRSPDEWKAADIKNGSAHYKDVYFEHDLKGLNKSPAEYSFEQVYNEFGIGKEETQQMAAGTEEMELG